MSDFERLLADQNEQFDLKSELLASIAAYANAPSSTASSVRQPDQQETRFAVMDGRDALAYVLIHPGPNDEGVAVDAGANGISKKQAAWILRRVADSWDPPAATGQEADDE